MYTEIILRLDGIKPKLASEICDHLRENYPSIDTIDTLYHTKPDGDDDQTEDEDDQAESAGQTESEEDQTESEDYHWYLDQTENEKRYCHAPLSVL